MEVKTAAWGTVGLVIVAFGAVVIYAIEREVIKNDLIKARNGLTGQQALLVNRKKSLSDLQDSLASIEAVTERVRILEEKNAITLKQVETLRENWSSIKGTFAKHIDSVRQKMRDERIPMLTLADGSVLKLVHFKEANATTIVLEHTDGIAKVPLKNMPPDWIGRLALGWNPTLNAELSGKPVTEEAVGEVVVPLQPPDIAEIERTDSIKRASITDAEAKIRVLEQGIAENSKSANYHLTRAADFASKSSGRQISSYPGLVRKENAAAEGFQQRISTAQQQLYALQMLIDEKKRKLESP